MTQASRTQAWVEPVGRRMARLPLVLLLTVGLLISLIHCASCGIDIAQADSATVLSNLDYSAGPDTPEQQLPCHSGHCLSHVTVQAITMVAMPADLVLQALDFWSEQFPASIAGLSLFKPPRA